MKLPLRIIVELLSNGQIEVRTGSVVRKPRLLEPMPTLPEPPTSSINVKELNAIIEQAFSR